MADSLSQSIQQLAKDGKLPGTGAIALDKSGKHIYNKAFGDLDTGATEKKQFTNDTQMIFWSCTKLLTSLAALQLLERGKIGSINDPVSKYLPGQAAIKVITGFDEQKNPTTRAAEKEMKLIHLFTHTAGYTYDFWDQLMFDYRTSKEQPPGAYVGLGAQWEFEDVFLEFDPGARYNYGLNIDILGFVVEEVSGMDLPTYIKQNITDPLGMTKTGAKFGGDDWLRCHFKSPEGQLQAVEQVVPAAEPYKYGGGHYAVSTLNDYSQVLLALLNEGRHPGTGKTILQQSTVKDYVFRDFIPEVGCPSDPIGKVPESIPPRLSEAGEILQGIKKGWSCGLMLNLDDVPERRRAGSGSWAGLGNLYYWIDPVAGRAGIFGTSILPFMDSDSLSVFDELEKLAYA